MFSVFTLFQTACGRLGDTGLLRPSEKKGSEQWYACAEAEAVAVERAFGSGGDFFVHGQQVALAGGFAVQKDMRQGAGAAFGGFGG